MSNGLVPMLKVFNSTAKYVDQGGNKRPGAIAIYLEPWHADVFEFLNLRKNTGGFSAKIPRERFNLCALCRQRGNASQGFVLRLVGARFVHEKGRGQWGLVPDVPSSVAWAIRLLRGGIRKAL